MMNICGTFIILGGGDLHTSKIDDRTRAGTTPVIDLSIDRKLIRNYFDNQLIFISHFLSENAKHSQISGSLL